MRLPRLFVVAALLAGVIAAGCQTVNNPGNGPTPGGAVAVATPPPTAPPIALPNRPDSLKFLVFGDFGTGDRQQYELAAKMVELYKRFPVQMVALVGDNLYGSERPQDFELKFEKPYKPLLDAKVKFYAALGNHDAREQRNYAPFNMDDKLYYSYKAPKEDVRFIALESTYPVPEQIAWLEDTLKSAKESWLIVYFHHPLYSSGGTHGSDLKLRETLEPLFLKYNVSVVFTGHDHIYERTKPQQGIQYFVTGSGGKLRPGDFRRGLAFSAKVVDDVQVFLAAEIHENEMIFNAISRTGAVVDSGIVLRREVK
jgi:hypothetical protein